jgi:MFS family permease
MSPRQLKTGYFILEGLNSFSTTLYLYYFYFFTRTLYGFDNKANLVLAAVNGLVYAVFSLYGGRFAQRFGYFTALKVGFGVMLGAFVVGSQVTALYGQISLLFLMVVGMCFTWPTLEALVSEGESRRGVQNMVGMYNVVWAGTGAIGYFLGGAILETLGLRSIFYVPMAITAAQLALTFWLERQAKVAGTSSTSSPSLGGKISDTNQLGTRWNSSLPGNGEAIEGGRDPVLAEAHPHAPAQTRCFLRMAWLANPFAYIAINTLVAVMPGIAARLGLSTMAAGFYGSIWCFSRLGAFVLLWFWGGWHYRFRWLAISYLGLVATFAVILLVPNLTALIAAQLAFGAALGLIYYSSLFYSMDSSGPKGEHGGIHEAAIGIGNFAGPAIGAVSLHLLPQFANSGAVAVTVLLLSGLAGITWIWRQGLAQGGEEKCP